MQGKQRWLGWAAIGLGVVALLVALAGRGFGQQIAAGGPGGQQSYAQPGNGPQANGPQGPGAQQGRGAPGMNAQPGNGPQANGPQGPGANAQPGNGPQANGQPGNDRHGRGAPGMSAQRGGRPDGGIGRGGLPFLPGGGALKLGLFALVALAGVWLLRGRAAGHTPASAPAQAAPAPAAEPAPESLSPTGEAYIEEPSDDE